MNYKCLTHIEVLHCTGGHVGILKVNKCTETFMQNPNAVNFSVTGKHHHQKLKPNSWEIILELKYCKSIRSHDLNRSRRCFSVSSVVTLPTHRELQGLVEASERKKKRNMKIGLEGKNNKNKYENKHGNQLTSAGGEHSPDLKL